jgi:hypothetical protein
MVPFYTSRKNVDFIAQKSLHQVFNFISQRQVSRPNFSPAKRRRAKYARIMHSTRIASHSSFTPKFACISHRPTKKRRRETQLLRSHTQENMLKVKIAADVRSFLVSFHRSRCYSAESVFAKKFRKQMPVVWMGLCVNGAGGLVGDAACRLLKAQQEIQKELACWNLSANFLSALNNQPPLYIFTWSQYTHKRKSGFFSAALFAPGE